MIFNTFCNICFIKQNIIKLCEEENERMLNILISFTSCPDLVNGIIYLCISCCNKLEEYDKFRELYLTNFVRFRYLYKEHKKKLELSNEPDIETQLKIFVDINVERSSGKPLIENYESITNTALCSRNNTTCNIDITYRESDIKISEIDLDKLSQKDSLTCANTSFSAENETQNSHVNYENGSFIEDEKNILDSTSTEKCEPSISDEDYNKFTNTENVATSIQYPSPTYECCNLQNKIKLFEIEETKLEKDEPNSDRFEGVEDKIISDTVATDVPYPKSEVDSCDFSSNPENCVTEDTTVKEGSTKDLNKEKKISGVCNVCNRVFAYRSNLQKHILAHTEETPISCDVCHKQFRYFSELKKHQHIHSSEKPYKCDDCGLGFTQSIVLRIHKRIHTGETPYSCDACHRQFRTSSSLKRHQLIHSGEKPYKCDECGLGFRESTALNRHKLKHTGEKPYSCDVCNKQFRSSSNLKRHRRIHSDEKPYNCDECGLGFTEKKHLTRHKPVHTGERPYSCDECNKSFTIQSYLIQHKRIHSGNKPYVCEVCGLGFIDRSQLNKHKFKHTEERPYSCDECHKTFKNNDSLTKHKRVHTGEKPYKCNECDVRFKQVSTLNTHKHKHSVEIP